MSKGIARVVLFSAQRRPYLAGYSLGTLDVLKLQLLYLQTTVSNRSMLVWVRQLGQTGPRLLPHTPPKAK